MIIYLIYRKFQSLKYMKDTTLVKAIYARIMMLKAQSAQRKKVGLILL